MGVKGKRVTAYAATRLAPPRLATRTTRLASRLTPLHSRDSRSAHPTTDALHPGHHTRRMGHAAGTICRADWLVVLASSPPLERRHRERINHGISMTPNYRWWDGGAAHCSTVLSRSPATVQPYVPAQSTPKQPLTSPPICQPQSAKRHPVDPGGARFVHPGLDGLVPGGRRRCRPYLGGSCADTAVGARSISCLSRGLTW